VIEKASDCDSPVDRQRPGAAERAAHDPGADERCRPPSIPLSCGPTLLAQAGKVCRRKRGLVIRNSRVELRGLEPLTSALSERTEPLASDALDRIRLPFIWWHGFVCPCGAIMQQAAVPRRAFHRRGAGSVSPGLWSTRFALFGYGPVVRRIPFGPHLTVGALSCVADTTVRDPSRPFPRARIAHGDGVRQRLCERCH
jgi:hypothetical protein